MYFRDLGKRCQGGCGPNVRAIGWLDNKHPFTKGPVSDQFLAALRKNLIKSQQYISYKGRHACELCSSAWNHYQLYIPTEKFLYIAPAMILHYVEVHQYQPPEEFIEAVLKCPVQGAGKYKKAIAPFMPLKRYRDPMAHTRRLAEPPELKVLEPAELRALLENFSQPASPLETDNRDE